MTDHWNPLGQPDPEAAPPAARPGPSGPEAPPPTPHWLEAPLHGTPQTGPPMAPFEPPAVESPRRAPLTESVEPLYALLPVEEPQEEPIPEAAPPVFDPSPEVTAPQAPIRDEGPPETPAGEPVGFGEAAPVLSRRAIREGRARAELESAAQAPPLTAELREPPEPQQPLGPPELREPPRSNGTSKARRVVTGVVIVALAGAVGGVGWVVGKPMYERLTAPKEAVVTDFPGPGHGEATVTVEPGDAGSVIAEKLVAAGVIATVTPFIEAFTEAGDQAAAIQPGTYLLRLEMSSRDALTALMDSATRHDIRFTVPEGKRADEVYGIIGAALATAELGAEADQATLDSVTAEQTEVVRQAAADTDGIGLPAEANGLVEGWLFPETYAFNLGTEPTEMLARMVSTTVGVLEETGVKPDKWLETLTIASMVEKESKLEPDRPKVARVFYNRLAKSMKLQSDATVVYGVGRWDGNVATSTAERDDKNPYNTYVIDGLPAGAICNPGKAAIEATVHPAQGAWLYFVAVNLDTGETEFNDTAEGHEKSVEKWRAWEAAQAQ